MRQESHRIFLQNFAPRSSSAASSFGAPSVLAGPSSSPTRGGGGGRAVVTTSAAVRLTDGARTCDVTKLLRGKFGLPSAPPGADDGSGSNDRLDKIRSRLSEFRGSGSSPSASTGSLDKEATSAESLTPLEAGQYDALVLIATLTSLPIGYISFEHEVGSSLLDTESNHDVTQTEGEGGSNDIVREEESTGPLPPDVRVNLDRSRSVSSAVTVKASNAVMSRQASSMSSTTSDIASNTKEGTRSNADPNRDPLEMSSSQGYPIVKVDPYRVRPAPSGSPATSSPRDWETTQMHPRSAAALRARSEEDLDTSLRDGARTTGSTNGGWAASLSKSPPTGVVVNEDGTTMPPTKSARPASPPDIRPIHISSLPKRVEYEVSPEPYNIVRTLRPNESPLVVRDEIVRALMERLRQAERELGLDPRSDQQLPTPQVRWFFQPSHRVGGKVCGRAMNVPGCVDLEGYCSGVEDCLDDDDYDNADDEPDNDAAHGIGTNEEEKEKDGEIDRWWTKGPSELRDAKPYQRRTGNIGRQALTSEQALVSDERHRLAILSRYVAALSEGNCICGYLLKRSKRDYNVWHRVHVILTEDSLFWVSRMKAASAAGSDMGRHQSLGSAMHPASPSRSGATRSVHFGPSSSFGRRRPRASRIGRHHMIKLTSTLLIESDPTQSSNPLSNVPNSFEVICPAGSSHVFRVPPPSIAGSSSSSMDPRRTCKRWVLAISDRIVRCFEGKGMETAELVGSEEAAARWGRIVGLSVAPFLDAAPNVVQSVMKHGPRLLSQNGWEGDDASCSSAAIAEVLRLGLDISEYRETIRNAQAALQAQGREDDEIIGRMRHGAITSSWNGAERVLVKSSCIISMVEAKRDNAAVLENILGEDDSVSNNEDCLERLKGDVLAAHRRIALYLEEQKVLRERSARGEDLGGNGEEEALLIPPADAFDDLLGKLQRLAASTEDRQRRQDERQGANTHNMGVLADLPPIVAGKD